MLRGEVTAEVVGRLIDRAYQRSLRARKPRRWIEEAQFWEDVHYLLQRRPLPSIVGRKEAERLKRYAARVLSN